MLSHNILDGYKWFRCIGVVGGQYVQNLTPQLANKPPGVDLTRDAIELNKTLPEMVSEGVRLDRTSSGPGNAFNYFYTILDDELAHTFVDNPSRLEGIIAQLNVRVCAMMPNYVQSGVAVKYHMKSRIDAVMPTITVNPGDCAATKIGK